MNYAPGNCNPALPDGQPVSRHTYGGLVYVEHADKMLMFGGSKAPCGPGESDVWSFDFITSQWKRLNSTPVDGYSVNASYDPATKMVYIQDQHGFYKYDYDKNTFTRLNDKASGGYHLSSTIDTTRKKYVLIGNDAGPTKVVIIDLETGARSDLSTTGGNDVINTGSPGISYDPVLDRVIGWSGGGSLYHLNLVTGVWTKVTPNNGPTFAPYKQGTFGRFGYVPALKIHVLINTIDQNVFVYKP